MDKKTLEEAIDRALDKAEKMVMETMNLNAGDKKKRIEQLTLEVKRHMDKELEEFTTMEKMGSAMHFRSMAHTMPMAQCWLTDVFVIAVGFFIRDRDTEAFYTRLERLTNYIVKNKGFFEPDDQDL